MPTPPRPRAARCASPSAVLAAYGFHPAKDILAQLLTLNKSVAANLKSGAPVTAPGLPAAPKSRADFISADCIQPN